MSAITAEIEAKIQTLSFDEKAELIGTLIAELDGPPDAGVEASWLAEARRRHREIIEGKIQAIPAELVFANLRAKLRR